jgi:hypothetical protein
VNATSSRIAAEHRRRVLVWIGKGGTGQEGGAEKAKGLNEHSVDDQRNERVTWLTKDGRKYVAHES